MAKPPSIHPATFSKEVVSVLWKELGALTLPRGALMLDPFAGLGHYLQTLAYGLDLEAVGIEIEPGYLDSEQASPCVELGDSRALRFPDGHFDVAVTSPAYPNGMSDSFRSNEDSIRHTYVHRLRKHLGDDYELAEGNAGGKSPRRSPKALTEFYTIHEAVWAEVYRVLRPGAHFFVNTKDPMRVPFRSDTEAQLLDAGFEVVKVLQVETPGLNHGKNRENKRPFEDITVVVKPHRR